MMHLIDIEGETTPTVMYKPYIYSKIVDCSNQYIIFEKKDKVKIIEKNDYGKEVDVLLRDPNRIDPFLHDIGVMWKTCAPDMRFGQLIENVFGEMKYEPWLLEEQTMLDQFKKYFNCTPEDETLFIFNKTQTNKRKRTRKEN